jgi:hypothetical protein
VFPREIRWGFVAGRASPRSSTPQRNPDLSFSIYDARANAQVAKAGAGCTAGTHRFHSGQSAEVRAGKARAVYENCLSGWFVTEFIAITLYLFPRRKKLFVPERFNNFLLGMLLRSCTFLIYLHSLADKRL